jgi:putative acetyltransferase
LGNYEWLEMTKQTLSDRYFHEDVGAEKRMIRQYKESDCEAIIEIWYTASLVATPFLSADFLMEERENIRTIWLPKAETWVYEIDRRVVGFFSLIGNEIGAIFVHPDSQRHGIGRALMDHAANMRDQLYLDVFEENKVGRRFYNQYGFQLKRKHIHEPSGHVQLRLSYKLGESMCQIQDESG